jgi:hypothetical protein
MKIMEEHSFCNCNPNHVPEGRTHDEIGKDGLVYCFSCGKRKKDRDINWRP